MTVIVALVAIVGLVVGASKVFAWQARREAARQAEAELLAWLDAWAADMAQRQQVITEAMEVMIDWFSEALPPLMAAIGEACERAGQQLATFGVALQESFDREAMAIDPFTGDDQ